MKFNNKVYSILKWVALIALPALATLIVSIGDIWGIPYKSEISLTITAINTFLGVLIGISTASYKGEGEITYTPNTDNVNILLNEEDTLEKASKSGVILLSVKEKE